MLSRTWLDKFIRMNTLVLALFPAHCVADSPLRQIYFGVYAAMIAAFAFLAKKPPQTAGTAKEKMTIAQAGDFFLYAPLYVALDSGIFEQEGLDAAITTTGGDDKTWAAVVSGSAQFGVADPTFVAVSTERGQPPHFARLFFAAASIHHENK